jgi:hypothetical protein
VTPFELPRKDERVGIAEGPGCYWPPLPARGIYCRHARGLVLKGIDLNLRSPDMRPGVMSGDVVVPEKPSVSCRSRGTG